MAIYVSAATTTKSIDVGSMFLMDLSVHESDPNDDTVALDDSDSTLLFPSEGLQMRPSIHHHLHHHHHHNQFFKLNENNGPGTHLNNSLASNQSIAYNLNNKSHPHHNHHHHNNHRQQSQQQQQQQQPDYLGNSLDRLANAMPGYDSSNGERKTVTTKRANDERNTNIVTIVEPQSPPEIVERQSPSASTSTTSSLSDESFVAGSGDDSLSGASYIASSEVEEDEGEEEAERGSTTTREDSGVLDMKDLDGQLNSYENEQGMEQHHHHHNQEKPISNDITNLISKSAYKGKSNDHTNSANNQEDGRPNNKPTKNINSNHQHNHRIPSKHSVSASLPIQVPARQMKRNLNKLKLCMINKIYDNHLATKTTTNNNTSTTIDSLTHDHQLEGGINDHDNQAAMSLALDDVDEFLKQEFNDNHHNHYPIDECEEENLRAEENPMKLFESIQALARSLHEDTELFGSLPPKRMLESPIRLALV